MALHGLLESGDSVPHYALETFASTAPEYMNLEQDVIRQGFHSGNYTWLKDALPVELAPDTVSALRKTRVERSRTGVGEAARPVATWARLSSLWGGGYYPEFAFLPEPYDRQRDLQRDEDHRKIAKRQEISSQGWKPSSAAVRLRHEPLICTREEMHDPRKKEPYPRLPVGEEPDSRTLREPLVPFLAGPSKPLADPSTIRSRLPEMLRRLQGRVDEDWEDCTVVVTANSQGLVQVAFYEETLDSELGALAYMNVLSRDPLINEECALRKVTQLWGVKRDFSEELRDLDEDEGEPAVWILYMLAPKWVRMRATDAIYTLVPGARRGKLSAAGESVLQTVGLSQTSTTTGGMHSQSFDLSAGNSKFSADRSVDSARGMPPQTKLVGADTIAEALGVSGMRGMAGMGK